MQDFPFKFTTLKTKLEELSQSTAVVVLRELGNVDKDFLSQWSQFLADNQLGEKLSIFNNLCLTEHTPPSHLDQWINSRKAVREVALGLEASGLHAKDCLFSLTHTGKWALACGIGGKKLGLGVDLERADRKISPSARARLLSIRETDLKIESLDAWVIKEACFKACPPDSDHKVVTQLQINSYNSIKGEGICESTIDTSIRLAFSVIKNSDWIAAFAVCQRK